MTKPAIHRVVAGTKAARQHIAKSAKITTGQADDPAIRQWNARVDAAKAAKRAGKNLIATLLDV